MRIFYGDADYGPEQSAVVVIIVGVTEAIASPDEVAPIAAPAFGPICRGTQQHRRPACHSTLTLSTTLVNETQLSVQESSVMILLNSYDGKNNDRAARTMSLRWCQTLM